VKMKKMKLGFEKGVEKETEDTCIVHPGRDQERTKVIGHH
jgi:hypothetical protein